MKNFDEIMIDCTKHGRKIKKGDYLDEGEYSIIDQGQQQCIGYSNEVEGLFTDVPAIIFGDHTRIVKYIDKPFYLGADGVKVLRSKNSNADYRYLYYAIKNVRIENTGYNRHFKWLKESKFRYPELKQQQEIASILWKVERIIELKEKELEELDRLIKSRFVELFGDPIYNTKQLPVIGLGKACNMKAGKFIKASDIRSDYEESLYPCFGGNGIRGYVTDYTHEGFMPLIGRQGALCGNLQYTAGKFYATEHAIVTQPLIGWNPLWLYIMLREMDLNRLATGAAQPGLNVSTLVPLEVINPDIQLQNEFAEFVQHVDKLKVAVQKSLDETQILFNSLMQEYFD